MSRQVYQVPALSYALLLRHQPPPCLSSAPEKMSFSVCLCVSSAIYKFNIFILHFMVGELYHALCRNTPTALTMRGGGFCGAHNSYTWVIGWQKRPCNNNECCSFWKTIIFQETFQSNILNYLLEIAYEERSSFILIVYVAGTINRLVLARPYWLPLSRSWVRLWQPWSPPVVHFAPLWYVFAVSVV